MLTDSHTPFFMQSLFKPFACIFYEVIFLLLIYRNSLHILDMSAQVLCMTYEWQVFFSFFFFKFQVFSISL